jgi:protein involved in ribonucleotide reduction
MFVHYIFYSSQSNNTLRYAEASLERIPKDTIEDELKVDLSIKRLNILFI